MATHLEQNVLPILQKLMLPDSEAIERKFGAQAEDYYAAGEEVLQSTGLDDPQQLAGRIATAILAGNEHASKDVQDAAARALDRLAVLADQVGVTDARDKANYLRGQIFSMDEIADEVGELVPEDDDDASIDRAGQRLASRLTYGSSMRGRLAQARQDNTPEAQAGRRIVLADATASTASSTPVVSQAAVAALANASRVIAAASPATLPAGTLGDYGFVLRQIDDFKANPTPKSRSAAMSAVTKLINRINQHRGDQEYTTWKDRAKDPRGALHAVWMAIAGPTS